MPIIKNQEYFFNLNAQKGFVNIDKTNLFYINLVKETVNGLLWMQDRNYILDYGCGIGETIDLYRKYETFEKRPVCHCERSEAIS